MIEKVKKYWLRYTIALAVGVILCLTYLYTHEFTAAESLQDRYRLLCDAFAIPGALLFLSGVLMFCTGQGAFDGITYSMGLFLRAIIPTAKLNREKYHEYVERKNEKRVRGYSFLLVCGAVFLIVALVFWLLFHSVYQA